jgi:PadR family transcriptional regulator, regulatory protein PadR
MKDIPSGGPARKYYRITKIGIEYSNNMNQEWHLLKERVTLLGI